MRKAFEFVMWLAAVMPLCLVYTDNTCDWGDDWAGYYAEARNIAAHSPVSQTHFSFTDYNDHYAPPCYPVGFPLVLAAAIRPGAPDMERMGRYMSIWCAVWIALTATLIRSRWGVTRTLCMVVIFLLAPYILRIKGLIWSDIPFSIVWLAGLYLYQRRRKTGSALIAGLCAGAAISMRSVGWVALLAVYADTGIRMIKTRQVVWYSLLPAFCFTAGAVVVVSAVDLCYPVPGDTYYLRQFSSMTLQGSVLHLHIYFDCFTRFITGGNEDTSGAAWAILILVAIATGIVTDRTSRVLSLAFIGLLSVILLYPETQDMRYVLPLLPIGMYYCLAGLDWLSSRVAGASYILLIGLMLCITWQRIPAYSSLWQHHTQQHSYGPFTTESRLGLTDIARISQGHGPILSVVPRVVGLLTGHDCCVIPEGDISQQAAKLPAANPAYILSVDERDAAATDRLARYCGDSLIYEQHGFRLYRCAGTGPH